MRSDIISVTVNIRRSLKERADAVKERRGDLTSMIENGLEREILQREQRKQTTSRRVSKSK